MIYFRSEIAFKVYQVNLRKCTIETIYRLRVPWARLAPATNAGLHSLQNSQINGDIIFVRFVTERMSRVRSEGQQKRAGILINWKRNSVSVVYIIEPEVNTHFLNNSKRTKKCSLKTYMTTYFVTSSTPRIYSAPPSSQPTTLSTSPAA